MSKDNETLENNMIFVFNALCGGGCDYCEKHPGAFPGDTFFQSEELTDKEIRHLLDLEFLWWWNQLGKLPPCMEAFGNWEKLYGFIKNHTDELEKLSDAYDDVEFDSPEAKEISRKLLKLMGKGEEK